MTERPAEELATHQAVPTSEGQRRGLLFGLFAGPLAWLAQLQTAYALVPWACAHGHRFVLLAASLAALVTCGAGGFVAWESWPGSGDRLTGEPQGIEGARLMSLMGVALSVTFAVAVIASVIPILVLRPCD
jgi:hypothetical protein